MKEEEEEEEEEEHKTQKEKRCLFLAFLWWGERNKADRLIKLLTY